VGDDFGGYEIEEEIGVEDGFDLNLSFSESAPKEVFEAALRKSPPAAILAHVQRLALHKMLGSKGGDRAVLLNDYVEKLKDYSEFAVFVACRHFWETNTSDFAPKLGKLVALVEEIESEISYRLSRLRNPPKPIEKKPKEPERADKPKLAWSAEDWAQHIADAEQMIVLAEQAPQFLNADEWRSELEKRKAECEAVKNRMEKAA